MSRKLLISNPNSKVINKWRSKIKNYPLTVADEKIDTNEMAYIEEIYGNSIIETIHQGDDDPDFIDELKIYQGYIKSDGSDSVEGEDWHLGQLRTGFINVKDKAAISLYIFKDLSEVGEIFYIASYVTYDKNFNMISRVSYYDLSQIPRSCTYAIEDDVEYIKFDFYNPDTEIDDIFSADWLEVKVNLYDEVPNFPLIQGCIDDEIWLPSYVDGGATVRTEFIDIKNYNHLILDIVEPNVNNIRFYAIYLYDDQYRYVDIDYADDQLCYNAYYKKQENVRYVVFVFVKPDHSNITPDEFKFNLYDKYDRPNKPVQLHQGAIDESGEFSQPDNYWYNQIVRTGFIDLKDYTVATINIVTPNRIESNVCISWIAEYDEDMQFVGRLDYDEEGYSYYNYVKKQGVRYIAVDFYDSSFYEPEHTLRPEEFVVEIELTNNVVADLYQGGLHSDGTDITQGQEYYYTTIRSDYIDLQDHTSVLIDLKSVNKDLTLSYIALYNKDKKFITYINFDSKEDLSISSFLYERDHSVKYIRFDINIVDYAENIEPNDQYVVATLAFDIIPIIPLVQGYCDHDGTFSDSSTSLHKYYVRTDYIDIEDYYSVVVSALNAPDFIKSSLCCYDKDKNIVLYHYGEENGLDPKFYNFEFIKPKYVKYITVDFYQTNRNTMTPDDVLVYVELKDRLHLTPQIYQGCANETDVAPPSFKYHDHFNLALRTDMIDLEGYPAVAIKTISENNDINIMSITEFNEYKYATNVISYYDHNHCADTLPYIKPPGVRYIMIDFCNYDQLRAITPDELTVEISSYTDLELTPSFTKNIGINGDGTIYPFDDCYCTGYIDIKDIDSFSIRYINDEQMNFSVFDEYDENLNFLGADILNHVIDEYKYKKRPGVRYIRFDVWSKSEVIRMYVENALEPKTYLYQGYYNTANDNFTDSSDSYHNYYIRTDFIPFKNTHGLAVQPPPGCKVAGLTVFDENYRKIMTSIVEDLDEIPNEVLRINEEYLVVDFCHEDGHTIPISPDIVEDVRISPIYSPSVMPALNSNMFNMWTIPGTCTLDYSVSSHHSDQSIRFIASNGIGPYMYIPDSWKNKLIHISATEIDNVKINIFNAITGYELMSLRTDESYNTQGQTIFIPEGGQYIIQMYSIDYTKAAKVQMLEIFKIKSPYTEKEDGGKPNEPILYSQDVIKAVSSVGELEEDGTYKIEIKVCDNKFFFGRGGKIE